ncbi:GDSL-type esterase/lipase family protein [Bosea psychrotolerans]|uniref:Lysophospholipase L1-like esterase n=1 Tax=Bosea psychrotolerans TaxID=1871628 RepID=A0A2S4LWX7_9HYPH|nr:GDSL-type esterase/lipase family protein [Bosea psychrotolerans]POR46957.1 lysophospholipase L1-like esterase [Bosea psychrotolerans]
MNGHSETFQTTLPSPEGEWTTSRYDDDVVAIRGQVLRRRFAARPAVFFGSSSFRYWHRMAEDLGCLDLANLGFGGGTVESGLRYFDSLLGLVDPASIVLYFGENDIANDGLDADSAFAGAQRLTRRIRDVFGAVPIYHLSIKHSPARWIYADEFTAFNAMRAESCADGSDGVFVDVSSCLLGRHGRPIGRFYEADGIHLNAAGYAQWAEVIAGVPGLLPARAGGRPDRGADDAG